MTANYIEYVKIKDTDTIDQISSYNTNLTKDEFMKLLIKMKKFNYKSFTKTYKQYIQDDIVYNNYENKDIKVYTLTPIEYEKLKYNFIKINYKKSKKIL